MAEKKKHSPPDGGIPPHLVNNLIEHTIGGFVLFYFNSETGEPEEIISVDSPAHSLALQKHIQDWQYAIDEVNHNMAVQSIENGIAEANRTPNDEDEED
jgi:hypothetical protein